MLNYLSVKRGGDVLVSFLLIIFLSPVLLISGVAIALESGLPITYTQRRVGYKGKIIKVLKFRTMYQNADNLQYKFDFNKSKLYKNHSDPRITKVGKVLRAYSIDEVLQLINVLRGELSLIGPRCFSVRDWEKFAPEHRDRINAIPGITGLWQVNPKRWDFTFEDIYQLDMWYWSNLSFWLDCLIIIKTVVVIIKGENK